MPDHDAGGEARLSALRMTTDITAGTISTVPLWTINRQTWKSSPALLPTGAEPRIVIGYGIGISSTLGGQGDVSSCSPLTGGIMAVNVTGPDDQRIAWDDDFHGLEGSRNALAVDDIDGDGRLDVVMTVQCYGKLHAYDGLTGDEQWQIQLGPYTLSSPTIGDLDGDGRNEIIVGSYDGNLWALEGGARTYLPSIRR
jgi:hypothetical protein